MLSFSLESGNLNSNQKPFNELIKSDEITLKSQTMRKELELNEKILELTTEIQQNHPELIQFLNKEAERIPYQEHPTITLEILSSQCDSLRNLLADYKANGIRAIRWKNLLNLPYLDLSVMELRNTYQALLTEVNQLKISYYDVGEGEVPIIFLHGFPFDKSMWRSQLDFLKSTNRVMALDLRGFGQSKDEKSTLSMEIFGLDLIAFMDKLKIKKAVVCGLSMGGYVALQVMKKFPERVKALILCDTQCDADTQEAREKRFATMDEINSEGTAKFNEKFIESVFHPQSLKTKTDLVDDLRNVVIRNSKEAITAGLFALANRSETCTILKHIQVPTLIICGDKDQLTPVEKSKAMHAQIPNSELKLVEDAGHVSNLEQPEAFNKYILDFIAQVLK